MGVLTVIKRDKDGKVISKEVKDVTKPVDYKKTPKSES